MKRIAAPCSLCWICLTVAGEAHKKPKRPGINKVTETINLQAALCDVIFEANVRLPVQSHRLERDKKGFAYTERCDHRDRVCDGIRF